MKFPGGQGVNPFKPEVIVFMTLFGGMGLELSRTVYTRAYSSKHNTLNRGGHSGSGIFWLTMVS